MRLLLAYPRLPRDSFWGFDRALKLSGRRSTMPPLGLLTVAGHLPPERFTLRLADENIGPITDAEIRWADVVLASGMVAQLEPLEELVARCRKHGTKVVVGGPLVSGCYAELLERGFDPDVWFLGEIERLSSEWVQDLERGELRPVYAHVPDQEHADQVRSAFGEESRILVEALPALSSSVLPRFDLIDQRHYHSMAVQASRGCPIGCEFCDIWKQFGLKSRAAPVEHLCDQLDLLYSLGWRGRVFVVDDNFIGNVAATRDLLSALQAWQVAERKFFVPAGLRAVLGRKRIRRLRRSFRPHASFPFAFSTEADVRLGADAPKMLALREGMARAGFNSVFLGIETPSADSLREARKKVNIGREGEATANLLSSVRRIQGAGLEVMAGFILGFDSDPADIDQAMATFIHEAGIPIAMVGLLGVIPGTALQERLEREGRYLGRLEGTQTHGFRLNFVPVGRSERVILDQYARVLAAVFGDEQEGMRRFYRRCERAMDALPEAPRTGDSVGWREVRAFLRSLVRVSPRLQYWAFLLRTLVRRPRFLSYAVVLALQGDHLHRLTVAALEAYRSTRDRQPQAQALPGLVASTEG